MKANDCEIEQRVDISELQIMEPNLQRSGSC